MTKKKCNCKEKLSEEYFKKKWKSFLDFEKAEYSVRKIYYYKSGDAFLLFTNIDTVKIKIEAEPLKTELIKISEIIGE